MERLPGFRDFYPEPLPPSETWSADLRGHIFNAWHGTAKRYGFREYDGPPLEPLELYTAKSGDEIVRQLYNFVDKGSREVALRPEMTPTLARMVASRERSYRKPIKWYSIPQLFRYEKHQKGRLREHFQFNADIFGESNSAADAELVALLIDSLRALGLTAEDFVVRISSRAAWEKFAQEAGLASEQAYDFYQAVDKLDRDEASQSAAKFQALGMKREAVEAFIERGEPTPDLALILHNLASRGLGAFVQIDYRVIRGLAYYTGPVFEAFDRKGTSRAIAGGGRYDHLVRLLSGGKVDLPGLGFGMGDVVLADLLRERGLVPDFRESVDVFVMVEEESLREASLGYVQRLRDAGARVDYSLVAHKADRQLKRALEIGAAYAACLDRGGEQVRWRDLRTRDEKPISTEESLSRWRRGREATR